MLKSTLLSFLSATLLTGLMFFAAPRVEHEATMSEAEEEGFGVNPGSRKYYEYMRNAQPDGTLPADMHSRALAFSQRIPVKAERSVNWSSRGPFNKGGRTRAFTMDVLDPNHLMAGGVTGGLWNSFDGGLTWTHATAPEQIHSVNCIMQDKRPGRENTWYYGSGEEFYGVVSGTSFTSLFSGDGMFKSTDNGLTWTQLESTSSNTPQTLLDNTYDYIQNIAIDHTNLEQDVVYAAVFNGVIRSTDGGNTWTEVLGFTPSPSVFVDVIITPSGVLYATFSDNGSNGGGIWRSTDGISWVKISANIENLRRIVMTYDPQDENNVFFLGETLNNPNYPVDHFLYRYTYLSGDGSGTGGVWEDRSGNLPDDSCELFIGVNFEFAKFRSQNSFDLCIAHHPTQDVIFIGGVNIHRSLSAFTQDDQDWIGGYRCNPIEPWHYSYPNHHPDQHFFFFSSTDPNVMYNANDGGLYRTDNCLADSVEWVSLNNGYVNTQYYTVGMEQGQATSDYAFGGTQDNGTWISNNTSFNTLWKEVHADDGSYCAMPEGRNFVITSSQLGKVQKKLIDAQGNLLGTERIDPSIGNSYLFINPLLLDPWNHNDLYIAGNSGLFYYNDVNAIPVTGNYNNKLETGWSIVPQSVLSLTAGSITALDKALINNNRIYYGTSQGKAYRLDNCFDPSPTRTTITNNAWGPGYISCITANDFNEDEVIMSFSNYSRRSIWHSTNGGTSWTDISGNLEENADGSGAGPAVYWVEIYPGNPAVYFAGTSTGLYSTSNLDGNNTIWEREGASTIGNVVVNMVKVRPYDGRILVGTHGTGVYEGSLPPVEAAGIFTNTSDESGSFAAYPNPFREGVSVRAFFAQSAEATLEIFDLSGRKIESIPVAVEKAGWKTIQWQPRQSLQEGTYLYRVNGASGKAAGKLIYRH